jgi:hypothetical protein
MIAVDFVQRYETVTSRIQAKNVNHSSTTFVAIVELEMYVIFKILTRFLQK